MVIEVYIDTAYRDLKKKNFIVEIHFLEGESKVRGKITQHVKNQWFY